MSQYSEVKELRMDRDGVFLVSACTGENHRRNGKRSALNTVLVALLLDRCDRGPSGRSAHENAAADYVALKEGFLGKPELLVEGRKGPSVSFSHAVGSTWAALCTSGASVGIDASEPGEFEGAYPYHRVFNSAELDMAALSGIADRLEAAALLWSAKEAVVKALGCGFHLLAPLDVCILPSRSSGGIGMASVEFSEASRARFEALQDATVRVASFREGRVWVSTALSSWTAVGNAKRF